MEYSCRSLFSNKTAALHKIATPLSAITEKYLLKRMEFTTASMEFAAFSELAMVKAAGLPSRRPLPKPGRSAQQAGRAGETGVTGKSMRRGFVILPSSSPLAQRRRGVCLSIRLGKARLP